VEIQIIEGDFFSLIFTLTIYNSQIKQATEASDNEFLKCGSRKRKIERKQD